jgi:hypothetical protein
MGHYYGEAKSAHVHGDRKRYRTFMRLSLLIPILIHGFYDFCASFDGGIMTIGFLVFIIVLDIIAFRSIRRYSREDRPV